MSGIGVVIGGVNSRKTNIQSTQQVISSINGGFCAQNMRNSAIGHGAVNMCTNDLNDGTGRSFNYSEYGIAHTSGGRPSVYIVSNGPKKQRTVTTVHPIDLEDDDDDTSDNTSDDDDDDYNEDEEGQKTKRPSGQKQRSTNRAKKSPKTQKNRTRSLNKRSRYFMKYGKLIEHFPTEHEEDAVPQIIQVTIRNCHLCGTGRPETLFYPCSHCMLCQKCVLDEKSMKQLFEPNEQQFICPMKDCKTKVKSVLKLQ